MNNDFRNYAVKHLGMNGLALDQYIAATGGANIKIGRASCRERVF